MFTLLDPMTADLIFRLGNRSHHGGDGEGYRQQCEEDQRNQGDDDGHLAQ